MYVITPPSSSDMQRCFSDHLKPNLTLSQILSYVGRGDSVVSSAPRMWKVAGSNPTLAATHGPWASPSLAIACSASAC